VVGFYSQLSTVRNIDTPYRNSGFYCAFHDNIWGKSPYSEVLYKLASLDSSCTLDNEFLFFFLSVLESLPSACVAKGQWG